MRRVLERLDEVGSTLVPLAYLAGLFLGTASYFTGYRGWTVVLTVGIGLALGSELHSFLQQRRARAAFAEYRRLRKAGGDAADAQETFRINVAILAGLVLFQCFTATAFAAATWPVSGTGLEVIAQDVLRGCIIPAFFLLSGFLVPLSRSAAAILTHASDEILHTAVSRNVRHWRRRINRVHRRGGDLSPLMVALLHEAGEHAAARRTTLIAENLTLAEAHMQPPWWARQMRPMQDGVIDALLPTRPPTGPGTPTVSIAAHETDSQDGLDGGDTNPGLAAVHLVQPADRSSDHNPQRLRAQQGPHESQVSGRSSSRNSKSGRGRTQRRAVEPAGQRIIAAISQNPTLIDPSAQRPRVRATAQVAAVAPSTASRHIRSNPGVTEAVRQRVAQ